MLRRVRRNAVGGDAREHRRHRSTRVQHRRTRRCGSCTRSTDIVDARRRRRPRGDAAPARRRDREIATWRNALRRSRSTVTGCLTAGSRRAGALTWMDARVDGMPVHAAHRQGGRGERALDPGAADTSAVQAPRGSISIRWRRDARRVVRRRRFVHCRRRRAARRRRRPAGDDPTGAAEPAARGRAPGRRRCTTRERRVRCRGGARAAVELQHRSLTSARTAIA